MIATAEQGVVTNQSALQLGGVLRKPAVVVSAASVTPSASMALYARAVAVFESRAGKICSAFLINPDVIATTRHCVVAPGIDPANSTETFWFGNTSDSDPAGGTFPEESVYALERLEELGAGAPVSTSPLELQSWDCVYEGREAVLSTPFPSGWLDLHQDIAYFRCPSKSLEGVSVYPVDIWTHLTPVEYDESLAEQDAWALHANTLSSFSAPIYDRPIYVSEPGELEGPASRHCLPEETNGAPNWQTDELFQPTCIWSSSSTWRGSSGGASLATQNGVETGHAIGVIQGHYNFVQPSTIAQDYCAESIAYSEDPNNPGETVQTYGNECNGAYWFNTVQPFGAFGFDRGAERRFPDPSPLKPESYAVMPPTVGTGAQQTKVFGVCRGNFYVSGVVGATSNGGTTGGGTTMLTSFGIVCTPYQNSPTTPSLREAEVYVYGTKDTHDFGGVPRWYPSWRNEAIQLENLDRIHAYELHCPVGYGVRAIEFGEDTSGRITSLEQIQCTEVGGTSTITRTTGSVGPWGSASTSSLYTASCAPGAPLVGALMYADLSGLVSFQPYCGIL